jgi:3-oxoacyl-[acyl-carrier-protein] synthase III
MAALDDARVKLSEIDWFVCTQSVGWFVDACRRELGLPSEKTIDTFCDIANIGAGAILYNVEALRKKGALKDGQTLLLYAPSAGFTRSAVVIRWHEPRS